MQMMMKKVEHLFFQAKNRGEIRKKKKQSRAQLLWKKKKKKKTYFSFLFCYFLWANKPKSYALRTKYTPKKKDLKKLVLLVKSLQFIFYIFYSSFFFF
jgi:hypothetical protein